ncbi:unnamed protein product [Prunus brigantina]
MTGVASITFNEGNLLLSFCASAIESCHHSDCFCSPRFVRRDKTPPSVNCAVSVACNIVVLANECINVQKL